jgi:hypothetical protein
MEDWKARQIVYHQLTQCFDDDLKNFDVTISNNTFEDAVAYFNTRNIGWVYPAKSYMVAICYARWLSEYFGGIPEDYLNDPELLYNNDPYFVEYSRDPETYHRILDALGGWNFSEEHGLVPDVKEYFIKEFMLDVDLVK